MYKLNMYQNILCGSVEAQYISSGAPGVRYHFFVAMTFIARIIEP